MSVAPDTAPPTIAGYSFTLHEKTGALLNLRIALGGAPLVVLARELAKLDGVRVTVAGGDEGAVPERGYIVHCLGFKMILSSPGGENADSARALVSRTPQVTLAVMSDLGSILERLMNEPVPLAPPERAPERTPERTSTSLRRSTLRPGQPLARRSELKRKTPLSRGPFRRT